MPGTQLWLPQHTERGLRKLFQLPLAPSHPTCLPSFLFLLQHTGLSFGPWMHRVNICGGLPSDCHMPSSPEFSHSRHSFQAKHLTLPNSSLGLSSLGNFLLPCRMSLLICYLHQLDEQQVEAMTSFVLFSAIRVSFSLLGLSCI